jgi:predicted nucleic acid-binding protein
MTPDLNVLLAASRADHPQHRPALSWLEQAIVTFDKAFRRLLGNAELTVLKPD